MMLSNKNIRMKKFPARETVYRIMEAIGLSHRPKRKPNGITRADKNARKSDDRISNAARILIRRSGRIAKLYVSAIFDCFDLSVLGLSMADNMRAELCVSTVENAYQAFPKGPLSIVIAEANIPALSTERSLNAMESFRA